MRAACPADRAPWELPPLIFWFVFFLSTEFVIEFEESQREPGIWREAQRVPGSHTSATLKLHGHADYRFRVSGVNDVGTGRPSEPSENYKTPARGESSLSVRRRRVILVPHTRTPASLCPLP